MFVGLPIPLVPILELTTWQLFILHALVVIFIGGLAASATLLLIGDRKYHKTALFIAGASIAAFVLTCFLMGVFQVADEGGLWRGLLFAFAFPFLIFSIVLFFFKGIYPLLSHSKTRQRSGWNWHYLWILGIVGSVFLIGLAIPTI